MKPSVMSAPTLGKGLGSFNAALWKTPHEDVNERWSTGPIPAAERFRFRLGNVSNATRQFLSSECKRPPAKGLYD